VPGLRVRTFLLPLLLFVLLTSQTALAVPNAGKDGVQDIWRVDLRPVAYLKACEQHFHKLPFFRLENNRWQPSDARTFFETQCADIPLIVFAQGYSLTTQETTQVGLALVRHFDPNKSCRVLFWDWYSDKGSRFIRRDLRNKIPIGYNASHYLALFLQRLQPQSKVCLFGFSFGSRIVCEAVEILRQSGQRPEGLRLNLVLSGAATDQHWFAQGQRHGRVPEIVERILVTYNPDDWVLWYYPLMYSIRSDVVALGLDGLPMRSIAPEFREQFENINVGPYVGHRHQTLLHVRTPAFRSRINTYFFFE
jgi:hypothetical protein